MNTDGMKFRTAVCPHCGATVTIGENISHITCSYCGSDILIDDAASETDRVLQAHSNARRRDYQTQLEYEKQKSDLEYEKEKKMQDLRILDEERRKKEEERTAFKKGKSSKLLIVFVVISLLAAISCFRSGKIVSGLIACVQTALFGGAWACGMQYINTKIPALHSLLMAAGLLLIIPFMLCNSIVYTDRPDQISQYTPPAPADSSTSESSASSASVSAAAGISDTASADTSASADTEVSAAAADTVSEKEPDQKASAASAAVTPEFKEAMDSYEAFFDAYIDFMNKMSTSDSTAEMLSEYSEYMTKYADTMEKMDAIDEDQLSPADDAYYIEVTTRITEKLAKVSLQQLQ